MKRKLFFWLEKLKITPQERITIVSLMILWLVLSLLNFILEPSTAADAQRYEAIRQEFKKRAQEEAELIARYNPRPKVTAESTMPQDTVPEEEREAPDTVETESNTQRNAGSTTVNVNSATLEQLQTLPGVGPVYAKRILAYRDSVGAFKSTEDLLKINGIGDKRLEDMKPMIEL